jgi:acyl-CoA dehydrogenase
VAVDFDFSDDQKQLQAEARRALERECASSDVRAVLDSTLTHDAKLWRLLGAMGFLGAAIPDAYGGTGAGYLELCVIAEELGRAVAPVPVCSSIYLAAECILLGGTEEQKCRWLPRLARGEMIGTLALSEGVGAVVPGTIRLAASGDRLTGSKFPVLDGEMADVAIVAARTADGAIGLFIVDLTRDGIERKGLASIDPTRNLARIDFHDVPAEPLGAPGTGWALVMKVLDRAAVLLAFEQLGGADRALELARDYALERIAFGRPIGSFQAIKHMLADMYVSSALARSNCYYGAWALATDSPDLPLAAATARVSATKAYQHCARNDIQVHGGMGFTWAFDCHLHYRRSNLLALALGSLSTWESRLIELLDRKQAA